MSNLKIPNKELDERVEKSYSVIPELQGKNKDVLKM